MVRTALALPWARIRSLVGELRSHELRAAAKKKKRVFWTLMSRRFGEKLQGEVCQKDSQLISHCRFYLGLLWGIRRLKSKGAPGGPLPSVPVFLPCERLLL